MTTHCYYSPKKPVVFIVALVLSLCFVFFSFNVSFLLESIGVEISCLSNAFDAMKEVEERAPGDDHQESEKEFKDFDDKLVDNRVTYRLAPVDSNSSSPKSPYLGIFFKEYWLDITSPPPDIC